MLFKWQFGSAAGMRYTGTAERHVTKVRLRRLRAEKVGSQCYSGRGAIDRCTFLTLKSEFLRLNP